MNTTMSIMNNPLRVFSTFLVCWWHFFFFCCFCSRSFPETERITITLAEAVNVSPDFSPSAYSYRHGTRSKNNFNDNDNDNQAEVDLGTTLVAIKYSGGVIVGADTRTSVGGYVSNKFAYKINPIFELEEEEIDDNNGGDEDRDIDDARAVSSSSLSSSSCVLCRSGSAADTQMLANKAKQQFRLRKLERPSYRPSISEVAHYLRYQMRDNAREGSPLQASLICAGYNAVSGGGQIFGIVPGGSLWEEDNFCVSGSGSTVLLGYLDALDTKHNFSLDYTEEKAIALVTKLLRLSIARDGSSGGLVRLYVINRNGVEERTVYPFTSTSTSSTSSSSSSTTTTTVSKETNYADLKGFAKPCSR